MPALEEGTYPTPRESDGDMHDATEEVWKRGEETRQDTMHHQHTEQQGRTQKY